MAEPNDEAAQLFDPTKLHTFEVEIAPGDLETINTDPSAEQYVPARLRFEGQTYPIGYRYKGSLGAFFPPCTNFLDGRKDGNCSVKISFNWMVPEGRFFGLKKLLFHAMNNDPSMLRERLGYGLFREMGVPASRASHAILKVNGQADVYALVEEVDSRFTRSRFTDGGKGNLYKEVWPVHDTAQPYINALETNDEAPAVERIQRFVTAVKQGAPAMAAWMDPDVTLSYMAVDRVIMNDDGAFHFYCFDRVFGNIFKSPVNDIFYWYEGENVDRLWVIPWDLDMAMNDTTQPPHLPTDWRKAPNPADCAVCASGSASGGPPSACDPIIHNFQAWQMMYEAKVDQFIAGPFNKAAVDAKLAAWKKQLADAGFRVDEQAITSLQATLDRARTNRGFAY